MDKHSMTETEHTKNTILDILNKELNTLKSGQAEYARIADALKQEGNNRCYEMVDFYQRKIDLFSRAMWLLYNNL